MATENITISKQGLLKAYRQAESEQKKLLENMFGKETFAINFNVMERVQTFQDACSELGYTHPMVQAYDDLMENCGENEADILAYLQLRIIVAALNEGWQPQYTDDEVRWYPWFFLYTKEEYEELDEKDNSRCVLRSGNNSGAYSGLACANAHHASSGSNTRYGGRLAFRSEELAAYAGRQFKEIYAEYFLFK